MSRLDVMKSFVRSAATAAGSRLDKLGVSTSLAQTVAELGRRRLLVSDARLTAAVAKLPAIEQATVRTRHDGIAIDAAANDGSRLLLRLTPVAVAFSPYGAKEWSVQVAPATAASDPRAHDVALALATEVAHTLWGPLLRGSAGKPGSGFVHREGEVLIIDLRSLPEVRAALGKRVTAAGINAIGLRAVDLEEGGLRLHLGLPSLVR